MFAKKWLPHHGLHLLEMQNLPLGSLSSQPIAEIKIKTEDKGQVTAILSRVSNAQNASRSPRAPQHFWGP